MSKSINEILPYFEDLYNSKSIYLWGANSETITPALCDKLYKTYGNSKYNKAYYDNKLKEGLNRTGADCSGALFPVSGFDTTSQNYYNKCLEKGPAASMPRDKACLVFRGASERSVNHVGFYCGNGYVIEMKSSKDNCVKDTLNEENWKWYGIPSWIDYSSTGGSGTYHTKCIDVSSYQGDINWALVKSNGIHDAILKVIRRDLNPDTKFEQNYTGCKNAGVNVIGVYNYSYAATVEKARTDAGKVLTVLNGRKTKVWLDVEDDCQKNLGSGLKNIINAYHDVIAGAGYDFGVYTGMSFYTSYIKPYAGQIKCTDWWIARYYNGYNKMDLTIDANEQYNPKSTIGRDIYGWQYTSSGQIAGIRGDVDINILYDISDSNKSLIVTPVFTETSITLLGKVITNTTNLIIREEPNVQSAKTGSYPKNTIVKLISQTSNGWYRTDKGYISGLYVKAATGEVYNCGGLNMRAAPVPADAGNIIGQLMPGTAVTLLKENTGWYQAKTNDGTVGWVSGKYIKIL